MNFYKFIFLSCIIFFFGILLGKHFFQNEKAYKEIDPVSVGLINKPIDTEKVKIVTKIVTKLEKCPSVAKVAPELVKNTGCPSVVSQCTCEDKISIKNFSVIESFNSLNSPEEKIKAIESVWDNFDAEEAFQIYRKGLNNIWLADDTANEIVSHNSEIDFFSLKPFLLEILENASEENIFSPILAEYLIESSKKYGEGLTYLEKILSKSIGSHEGSIISYAYIFINDEFQKKESAYYLIINSYAFLELGFEAQNEIKERITFLINQDQTKFE